LDSAAPGVRRENRIRHATVHASSGGIAEWGLLAFIFFCMAGCGGPARPSTPAVTARAFVDDSGYTLQLDGVPKRVVALAPSLVEIICAVGGDSQLVGVSSYSDFPPHMKALPIAGSYVAPNIEQIVALHPDLLVMVMEGPPKEAVARLRELGVKTAVLRSSRVADIPKNIRWLGDVLGRSDSGAQIAAAIERRYEAVKAVVAHLPRPKTLYAIALNPVITAGRTSFINDLITDAGGRNIAGDLDTPYPRMTLETIIDRAPDIIFFGGEGMGSEAAVNTQLAFWRRWPNLPAVRNDGLREINRNLINRPSPRIAESLAELAGTLHPEKRAEIDKALRDE
jgi:iron complex transport system substrate-binding protein